MVISEPLHLRLVKSYQRVGHRSPRKGFTMGEVMNGLATIDVKDAMSAQGSSAYCSLASGTMREKAALYNAMSNPEHKVGDYINRTIVVRDLYVETVEITNEETGDITVAPRVVLIDTNGSTYQAVSKGVFTALTRLIRTFGEPTWEDGLPVIVRQISLGRNQMLTLEVDINAL